MEPLPHGTNYSGFPPQGNPITIRDVNSSIRNTIVGVGGGGIVGAAIWGAIEMFDISWLLAWIIAGATVGGFEASAWMIVKRRIGTSNTQYGSAEEYRSTSSRGDMKRNLAILIGAAFFGIVAAIHGVTATAASSMIFLGILWLFVPTPLVFLASMWRPLARYRKLSNWYLATSTVLSILVLAGVGWIGSERGIHPSLSDDLPVLADYPQLEAALENVTFQSSDGTLLSGWFIPGESPKTVILLHGFTDIRDKMLPHADFLHDAGYSVLLFDFRSRGQSAGDAVTLGFHEQGDVQGAVQYLKDRQDADGESVGVLGISMGGATAILGAAETPELTAVVSESAFKSVDSAIASSFEHFIDLPAFPFAPITVLIIEKRLGIKADQVVPEDRVGLISPRPVFIIHGQEDETIVPGDAEAIYAAAKEPKEDLWFIPGAGHAEGVEIAPEEYAKRVVDFFNLYLEP
ncbi:MAG: alpha/beta hydrolase [Chloroflexi bacterium]|nr:alpha/beta hydrolase [Chloroflexota bacterium]